MGRRDERGVTAGGVPLAHSAKDGRPAQTYADHLAGVRLGTATRADEVLRFAVNPPTWLAGEIKAAATWHDLGKLDEANQAELRKGELGRPPWDHIDAGVAHLCAAGHPFAAWLVRAHHAPGLPQEAEHFKPFNRGRRLRGRRDDDLEWERHEEQRNRTDKLLAGYFAAHRAVVSDGPASPTGPAASVVSAGHGLAMRLALSCLVDADHADTARHYSGYIDPDPPSPRWDERLAQLTTYVRSLPAGASAEERDRNRRRRDFFEACLVRDLDGPLVACEGPVGIGKTTAVAAYLIRQAMRREPWQRRLIVIAPYTNILTQTADRLREALVLPDEREQGLTHAVVVEHHHRADFERERDRDLAVLWRAPVVLTTAVSFFEALAAANPAALRKLHAVPGSAVFIDEAHAALPAKLWPQNWRWVRELAEEWGCRFVLASGTLARFWEDRQIVDEPCTLPELMPAVQAEQAHDAERQRVRYRALRTADGGGMVLNVGDLVHRVTGAPGPRLVILNTVQTAAVVARAVAQAAGKDSVLHLSTALTPNDRSRILDRIKSRLQNRGDSDWALMATSCVEAGVDLSFQTAFRERFAAASTLQTAGRVNRHGERGLGDVYDFALSGEEVTQHPAAKLSAPVLLRLIKADALNAWPPARVVTEAMRRELLEAGGIGHDRLSKAERERDYPGAQAAGRVIDADTRIVVVEKRLRAAVASGQKVGFRQLLSGSVQLWATRIEKLGMEPLPGRDDIYEWTDAYDRNFDGIMAGVLRTNAFLLAGGGVI